MWFHAADAKDGFPSPWHAVTHCNTSSTFCVCVCEREREREKERERERERGRERETDRQTDTDYIYISLSSWAVDKNLHEKNRILTFAVVCSICEFLCW